MTGLEISGPGSWYLLNDARAARLMAPGLLLGAALYALQSERVPGPVRRPPLALSTSEDGSPASRQLQRPSGACTR